MASSSSIRKYTTSKTIEILVGTPPNRQSHNLYTSLLSEKSPFFRAKLASLDLPSTSTSIPTNTATGTTSTNVFFISDDDDDDETHPPAITLPAIKLPTTDPEAFTQYADWLYDRPLLTTPLSLVVDSYLLGHEFSDEAFRNDLIDALRTHYSLHPIAKVDLQAMITLCKAMPPSLPENKGKVQLLEVLVAQLTYKILVRGWSATEYRVSKKFKELMAGDGRVVMWHLDWLHRLNCSASMGAGAGVKGKGRGRRKRVKRELDGHGFREGEGIEEEDDDDGDDEVMDERKTERVRKKIKLSSGAGVEGFVNPASEKGCKFHEHKETTCKNPEELVDD